MRRLSRYRIERIVEFYASTEGNVNMVNNTGKVGAIGVIPWFAEMFYPILLLRVDPGEHLTSMMLLKLLWRCCIINDASFGSHIFHDVG